MGRKRGTCHEKTIRFSVHSCYTPVRLWHTAGRGGRYPYLAFSYEEDLECYGRGFGVRTSEFLNTEPVPVATKHQAVELARRECKTDYPEFHVSHDPETGMWCVAFYLGEKVLDGGESVYLDSNGITKMILSGE